MRISVVKDDAGEALYTLLVNAGRKVVVWLDGVKQGDVVMADEASGILVRYARRPNGELKQHGDTLVSEMLKGRVRIDIERS